MNILEAVKKFFLDDTDNRYEENITELPQRAEPQPEKVFRIQNVPCNLWLPQ